MFLIATVLPLGLGCGGVFYLFIILKEYLRKWWINRKIPGPKTVPLLGNVLDLLCEEDVFFQRMRKYAREYGPVYRLAQAHVESVNITGAEEFEAIAATMKNIEKGTIYEFLHRWLGDGLLTSTGPKWQARRKILTTAFHFSILPKFVAVFNDEALRLVEVLKKETDKPFTNIVPIISQFTLFTIAETSMGTKLNVEGESRKYVSSLHEVTGIFLYRLSRPWLYFNNLYYYLSPTGRRERTLLKILQNFSNDIISKRSNNFQTFKLGKDGYNYSERKKLAFLDLLLNAKLSDGIIDDEGIQDEVNTFMFEGHDTNSMSICFTLMLLATHRNWQELIHQEMMDLLGPAQTKPTMNDLNELKIMETFIKESLRLYPSVPFISRKLEEDMVINGYYLPRAVETHLHIFDIHRNPKYWSDPEKFDPDRFLPENCTNRHPFAYLPFSAGPRNCIGQKFAMLEQKAVIYQILRNFILEPIDTPDTIKLMQDMVLRTKKGILRVKFKWRGD